MQSQTKRASTAHRVVCTCQSRGCFRGQYVDAHGNTQFGVEVVRETREAHIMLHRRTKARSIITRPEQRSDNQDTPPLTRTEVTRSPGDLISPLTNLHISTPDLSVRHQQAENQISLALDSSDGTSSNFTEDSEEDANSEFQAQSPIISHIPVYALTTKTCTDAIASRALGLQEYNCGKSLHFIHLLNTI